MQARLAGLDVTWVGGGDRPVVLLHGFGAPGDDLVPLAEVLAAHHPAARFAIPAAPISLGAALGYGRAWWHLDLARFERALGEGRRRRADPGRADHAAERDRPFEDTPEGLAPATQQVQTLLDELARAWPAPPVLGGFSQGAMLALDVAARSDRPLGGLIALSGTVLARDAWARGLARRAGLAAFLSHGTADSLLPYDDAEELRELCVAARLDVEWVPFVGAHEIPPIVLHRLTGFLSRILPAEKPGEPP